jgi:hypothetical protein
VPVTIAVLPSSNMMTSFQLLASNFPWSAYGEG